MKTQKELPKRVGGGLGQFADLRGDLAKKKGAVFLRGCLYHHYTLWSMCAFKSIIQRKKTVDCFMVT